MKHGVRFWRAGNNIRCEECNLTDDQFNDWLRHRVLEFRAVTMANDTITMYVTGHVQDTACTIRTPADRKLYDRFFIENITHKEAEGMIATYKDAVGRIDYVVLRDYERYYGWV